MRAILPGPGLRAGNGQDQLGDGPTRRDVADTARTSADQSRREPVPGSTVRSCPCGRLHGPYPSLAFRRLRALTILLVAVALVNMVVHLLDRPATAPAARPGPRRRRAGPRAAATARDRGRRARSPTGTRASPGHLAVVVADLQTGRTTSYGDTDHAFATASVVKVDILATLLLQKQGRLSSAQREVAGRMIRQSSNGAATTLWKAIGREKGLAAANATFGLTGTKGGTKGRWGATTTTHGRPAAAAAGRVHRRLARSAPTPGPTCSR